MAPSGSTPVPAAEQPRQLEIQAYLFYDPATRSEAEHLRVELRELPKSQRLRLHSVPLDARSSPILGKDTVLPRLEIGPYRLAGKLRPGQVEELYQQAQKRLDLALAQDEKLILAQFTQKPEASAGGRFGAWFGKHYLAFFLLLLALYVSLPLAAPVFMTLGWQTPAKAVYTIYKPLCHQLAYRSFFLFGDQAVYPREAAHVHGIETYEEVTGLHSDDLAAARGFTGNEELGYKVALCERDMAIYGSLLLFGLIFALTGKRIKGIHWFVWIGLGLLPIALDGFSQLLSQIGLPFLEFLRYRESTPALRVLTGALFGWFTGWFAFPTLRDVFEESQEKQARVEAILRGRSELL